MLENRDTWRERLLGAIVCRVFGHTELNRMFVVICARCRVVLRHR